VGDWEGEAFAGDASFVKLNVVGRISCGNRDAEAEGSAGLKIDVEAAEMPVFGLVVEGPRVSKSSVSEALAAVTVLDDTRDFDLPSSEKILSASVSRG
jgi:hypothetical protein